MFAFILVFLVLHGSNADEDLKVATSSGILNGFRDSDTPVKLFLGVPYANPPIGDLRFRYPTPFEGEGIERDAKSFAPICYQPPHAAEVISPLLKPNQAEISEDCLYLNIYVPDVEIQEPIPVLVWLAGEGFNYADPVQYDGRFLSGQGKVILVTVSFRVSVFGFLSGLHGDAPGNVGLFDQRSALEWVKNNIKNFGGDAERVTLFGRFTGSMSAAIHAFSPLSKEQKLFQKVILQSGVPSGDWAFDRNPLNATLSLAQVTDCAFSTMAESIACIKRIPADVLLNAAIAFPWRPTFDFNLIYENTFKAAAKLEYNPIDILIGTNNNEGSLCLTAYKAMKSEFFDKIVEETLTKEDFSKLIKNAHLNVFREITDFIDLLATYEFSASEDIELRNKFVDFCGDLYVTAHSQKLADVISTTNRTVFLYELVHRPSFSHHPSFITAGHGDDVLYALGLPLQMKDLPQLELKLTHNFISTISNFAYNGNPNSENSSAWPAYTKEDSLIRIFDTDMDHEVVQKSTHDDAVLFWHKIIPAARQRSCPLPPVASALVDIEDKQETTSHAYFLGAWIPVPSAQYALMALLCISGLLVIIVSIGVMFIIKMKQNPTFERLK